MVEGFSAQDEDFIVFLFFAVFIGALVTYLISRFLTELHYTVILFFLGVVIAVVFNSIHDTDLLRISILQWEGFSGDMIIYVFLPALLFGDSMTLNFHHVRENISAAALLAGPGALMGAFLTAVFVKYVLPYHWEWNISLLFGAITCATDPVGKKIFQIRCVFRF
jgi:CPA1 family monovalent cation:H+ antiporter